MKTIRTKFYVSRINRQWWKGGISIGKEVLLKSVIATNPEHKDYKFWQATPSGEITINVQSEGLLSLLEVGREFYVDFIPTVS